jgi:hypothetical protein
MGQRYSTDQTDGQRIPYVLSPFDSDLHLVCGFDLDYANLEGERGAKETVAKL